MNQDLEHIWLPRGGIKIFCGWEEAGLSWLIRFFWEFSSETILWLKELFLSSSSWRSSLLLLLSVADFKNILVNMRVLNILRTDYVFDILRTIRYILTLLTKALMSKHREVFWPILSSYYTTLDAKLFKNAATLLPGYIIIYFIIVRMPIIIHMLWANECHLSLRN